MAGKLTAQAFRHKVFYIPAEFSEGDAGELALTPPIRSKPNHRAKD